MRYCKNKTLQLFIEKLVEEMKFKNENKKLNGRSLDIPFLISVLSQDFNDNENRYTQFIFDLKNSTHYNILIEKSTNEYNGICRIIIYFYIEDGDDFGNESNFKYDIEFAYDERNYGWCECEPGDMDYREDYGCCGHGCDWDAPELEMRKSFLVSNHSWNGDQHDYWNFEDKFYSEDKEETTKRKKVEKENKVKRLKETIENAQKELKELENL